VHRLQPAALRVVDHRPPYLSRQVLVVEGGVAQQVEVLLLPRAQQPPVVRRALLYLIEQRLLR